MASGTEYWVWLQTVLGYGARVDELLFYYGSPEQVYNAFCRREIGQMITPAVHRKMTAVSPSQVADVQKLCREKGWHIVTPDSEYYPAPFRQIAARPLALYVQGDPALLKREFNVGFVGTRNASRYGREMTRKIAYCVASAGATVVSGCAVGVDTASHIGALQAKGATVGFLGTALGVDYPRENRDVREAIARNGALVTEYQPGVQGSRTTFPIRNRLIAAFSVGVVVTEAAQKSGSLITASYAAEYGKDVFAVPGEIDNSAYSGSHALIRDGAKPVFGAADILEEYVLRFGLDLDALRERLKKTAAPASENREQEPAKERTRGSERKQPLAPVKEPVSPAEEKAAAAEKRPLPPFIDETGEAVYDCLLRRKAADADTLASETGFPAPRVLAALTMLELAGVVQKDETNRFRPV